MMTTQDIVLFTAACGLFLMATGLVTVLLVHAAASFLNFIKGKIL